MYVSECVRMFVVLVGADGGGGGVCVCVRWCWWCDDDGGGDGVYYDDVIYLCACAHAYVCVGDGVW